MKNKIIEKIKAIYYRIHCKRALIGKSSEYLDPNDRENKSYEQIKKAYETLRGLFTDEKHKFYISGGVAPYLLLNQESGRTHDDIDIVVRMEDMSYFRQALQEANLYKKEYDSKTFARDGIDYGFETVINGVPVGIYPFIYKDKKVIQHTYDPYTRQCKIKELEVEQLSDYVMTYTGLDGQQYDTMSMEYIRFSKSKTSRPKDIADIEKVDTYGIREDVYNRLHMFRQTQDIKAERLAFIKGIEEKNATINSFNACATERKPVSREEK